MKKGVIFAALAVAVLFCLINEVSATNINSCQNISSSGNYVLTQNVSSSGTCMNITVEDVILDCNGYTINFSSSSPGAGVYSNSNNTTVMNCVIRQTSEQDDSYGIEFDGANNGFVNNNSIIVNGESSFGVYFNGADYNHITNTNTTNSGPLSFGLVLSYANYNNVTNYRESSGLDFGIHLSGANHNNFVNVTSIIGMDNLYLTGGSEYNHFENCYFEATYSGGLLASWSDQNSFVNTVFAGIWAITTMLSDVGEYNFTNCTFDKSKVDIGSGKINVFWYVDAYVNDSNGNALGGANVTAYNVNNISTNGGLTNSSGFTQRLILREYMQNATGIYYDSNYTFNANKTGYSYDTDSGPLTLTTNYIDSNKAWITLTDDNALTSLFGANPVDNYNSNSSNITFDFKCSYNSSIDSIQLWTNSTGTWKANYTNNSYTYGTWLNITVQGIPNNQNYKWAVYCNTSGSSDWTGNRTFNVDATPPVAEQGINPIDYYNDSGGIITFDLKCSDNVAVNTMQLWTNITGIWQASYSNSDYDNDTWLNITLMGIHNGNYRWAVYCKDTSNSGNWTSNRTFNVTDGSKISDCTNITFEGVYTLNQSVFSNTTCFNILTDDVTLDCNGYTINFSSNWSNEGAGVYSNSSNTTIKNCIIKETADADDSYGIEFDGANNGRVENNSIIMDNGGYRCYGVYFHDSDYNLITNINTTSPGFQSVALLFDGSDYNNVTNFEQISGWGGIFLALGDYFVGANHNNFVNVTSISRDDSLGIGRNSGNNTFTDCYFESTNGVALNAALSEKNSFLDSVFNGTIFISNYAQEYNFTNCTLNGSVSVNLGPLNVFWYADVYVNDSLGNAMSGANVTAKNVNNVLKNWSLTNSSGYIKRIVLREYFQNSSGKFYDTNYNFNATKTGYTYDSEQVNLTSNAIPGDLGKVVLTLSPTSAPNISMMDNQTIYLPDTATLATLVTSESDFTTSWSKVSGPGSVTFSKPDYSVTDVIFSNAGDYVLRLTADDGQFSRYEEVSVTVLPEPVSIKVKKSGTGSGTVSGNYINCGSDCSETFDGDVEVSLTATPSGGSVFVGWVGSGCLGNSSDVCDITVNGTKEVTAFFDTNTTAIRTFYVATNGSDSNNGSIDFPWLTIQHAADNVTAGDKVIIRAGTYNESLTFSNSGNSTHPIVFEGERDANGNWLTIVDPSTDASSGWIAAPEIGDGVWKKDVGFPVKGLIINNKRIAHVYSMGDMIAPISTVYSDVDWTTGADLLSVPPEELAYLGSQRIRFWDGLEALWGDSGNTVYLRLRNGSNPNGVNIHIIPPSSSPNFWDPSTSFFISGCSYLDFRNFNVKGSTTDFFLLGFGSHHITIENNNLSSESTRVYLNDKTYQNIIRNNVMTNHFYGYSDPGAWGVYSPTDYRYVVRMYQYLLSKYIMGNVNTVDTGIFLYQAGDDNSISGNYISKGLGQGISIMGINYTNPTSNTEVYNNVIEHQPSIGIALAEGQTNTKVYDNLFVDSNIHIRLHHMDTYGELNRTIYIYRNKFWLPEYISNNIFAHFYDDPDATYKPEVWIYHNSFSGGWYDLEIFSMAHGLNLNFLDNIFSEPSLTANVDEETMQNVSMMGVYDYNFETALFSYRDPPYPVWWGEHNVNQTEALWDLDKIPDYSLESDSAAIDSGIDLSQNFTINGTNYTALPGMEPGYFRGSAPDMGAVEYDNSTMIITRNKPIHGYITDDSSITFEFKCFHNSGVETIELFTDTTGDWHLNYSNSSYTSNTWLNITINGIAQGNHKWMIFCNGTDGNSSFTGNRTFTVDLIDPVAEQGTNPTAGYEDSSGSIKFDMKCSDNLGVSSIQLQSDISGSLQTEYTNSSYQNDTWLNITIDGITSGSYIWQVYCEDTAGNSDTTSTRAFSSTFAEEEQEEQKKGGGGGGGGGGDDEIPTNQTRPNQNDNNLNNINNTNQSQGQDSGTAEQKVKNKLQKYWWLILATVVVIAGLIILGSIKKKESF